MFSKRGSLVWSEIRPLVNLYGEEITTEILMEVGKILDARGVFEDRSYSKDQINEIAEHEFKIQLVIMGIN